MTTHRRGAVLVLAALPATTQGFKDLENRVVETPIPR